MGILVSVIGAIAGMVPGLATDPNGLVKAALDTQVGSAAPGLAILGVAIGCGMIILGAGLAIGLIGSRAVESIARQPEAYSKIFSTTIIAAALVEGVTFFALIICFLALYWTK